MSVTASKGVVVRPIRDEAERETCARLMSESEPWTTLGRSFELSLRILRDPTRQVHVADIAGRVAGFIVLCESAPLGGYIQSVCVDPALRGNRIGTALLEWAEERLFGLSPHVLLCVSTFNPEALRLYLRLGYEVIGELRDHLVRGHGEILLRKSRGPLAEFRSGEDGSR